MNNIKKRNNHQTIKDFIGEHKIIVLFCIINTILFMSVVFVYAFSFYSIKSLQKENDSLREEYKDVKKSNTILMINKDKVEKKELLLNQEYNELKESLNETEEELKSIQNTLNREEKNFNYERENLKNLYNDMRNSFSRANKVYNLNQIKPNLLHQHYYTYRYKETYYRSYILNETLKTYLEEVTQMRFGEICYSSLKDTINGSIFHKQCDDISPTLTLYQNSHNHIFGGLVHIRWNGVDGDQDNYSYLINISRKKVYNIKRNKTAINSNGKFLPSFGEGDIIAFGDFNYVSKTLKSYESDTDDYEINEGITDFYPVAVEVYHMV